MRLPKPLVFALIAFTVASCIPRKRLIYLQDKKTEIDVDEEGFIKTNRTLYRMQKGDMMMISIKSMDEEMNKLFEEVDLGGMQQGGGGMGGGQGGGGDFIFFLRGQTINQEGFVKIPILGNLYVEGLTEEEIQKLIDERLKLYFKESSVFSRVRQAGIRFVTVGEVNAQGRQVVLAPYLNIIEAIAFSGGITVVGDRRNVQIFRQSPEGIKVYEVDLTDRSVINNPLFYVQPNDIIQVKPLRQRTFGLGEQGFSTFTGVVTIITSSITTIFLLANLSNNN